MQAQAGGRGGAGPRLFVGGQFTSAGGQSFSRIAKWNGIGWSALGAGVNGTVLCMIVFDDGAGPKLYVGGAFGLAGGSPAMNIARWNGQNWSALGSGVGTAGQAVYALAVYDDGSAPALYAAGSFSNGSSPNIARWNGTSWTGVGAGSNSSINALAACQHGLAMGLYAGGSFTSIGGIPARYIARWNGAQWNALPSTVAGHPVPATTVRSLFSSDNGQASVVSVGTDAYYAGELIDSQIPRWNGSDWNFLGSGVDGSVLALAGATFDAGPQLFVGGGFTMAGGRPAYRIVQWYSAAPYADQNRNRRFDACDISTGASTDCDNDGVPDEVQAGRTYVLDEGTFGASWALTQGGDYLWLNRFTVRPHGQIIHCVEMPWTPYGPDALPLQILVYRDPNNDGNPADAQLVAAFPAYNFYSDFINLTYARILIPPTYVGRPGESWIVYDFGSGGAVRDHQFVATSNTVRGKLLNIRTDNSAIDGLRTIINGKQSIATGLYGLDCEHDCLAELHPLYVLAVHVKSDPADDVWAIFVRRSGDEGYCSTGQMHNWSTHTVSLVLPGSGQATISGGTEFYRERLSRSPKRMAPTLYPQAGGALVTFDFGTGPTSDIFDGELHIKWTP